jgi:hypothetical protein
MGTITVIVPFDVDLHYRITSESAADSIIEYLDRLVVKEEAELLETDPPEEPLSKEN